jgi:predicted MFS family arabinose efflux permease
MAVGGVLAVLALLKVLPVLPALPHHVRTRPAAHLRAAVGIVRSRPVALLCLITAVLVIGQFAAYTYIAPLVRRDGGLEGFGLSALLLGYGAAGLIGNIVVGRYVDRRPGPVLMALLGTMVLTVGLLAPVLGPVPTWICALAWGGMFTAVPVCLASAPLRVAPRAQDAASAVYVVAFQVGIGGGALVGERFVRAGLLGALPLFTAGLALVACVLVAVARQVFPSRLDPADEGRALSGASV